MGELDRLLHDYLSRGRRLHTLDLAALEQRWFAAIERANRAEGWQQVEALREMNYIEAELQLRGLEPPPPRAS